MVIQRVQNADDVKKLANDHLVVSMVTKVLHCQAHYEVVHAKVKAYTEPIFQSYQFYVESSFKRADSRIAEDGRILDEKLLYLTDLESEQYHRYMDDIRDAHLANGFADLILGYEKIHDGERGWCPALIAENDYLTARNELAEHVAKEWLGLKEILPPHSGRLVDLVVSLCLSAKS